MLVLSRHRDESIIIGDDIVITVVDIRGDKVRLGIAAPIEISVHRQEVYEAIGQSPGGVNWNRKTPVRSSVSTSRLAGTRAERARNPLKVPPASSIRALKTLEWMAPGSDRASLHPLDRSHP